TAVSIGDGVSRCNSSPLWVKRAGQSVHRKYIEKRWHPDNLGMRSTHHCAGKRQLACQASVRYVTPGVASRPAAMVTNAPSLGIAVVQLQWSGQPFRVLLYTCGRRDKQPLAQLHFGVHGRLRPYQHKANSKSVSLLHRPLNERRSAAGAC
ncbi:hypothetical protein J1614_001882, partial [Plenodomus biglobosus]